MQLIWTARSNVPHQTPMPQLLNPHPVPPMHIIIYYRLTVHNVERNNMDQLTSMAPDKCIQQWLHERCHPRVSKVGRNQSGYITPAFSACPQWGGITVA